MRRTWKPISTSTTPNTQKIAKQNASKVRESSGAGIMPP